ncbi:MAG: ABC transporter ATP-binding protein [Pseudomonadota bacterium]
MPLLELRNVSKFFGGLAALAEISFGVNEGETLSIIGPNGAGKSTLFNVITGFHHPDRGDVSFCDEKISHLPPHRVAEAGVARTFQITTLFPNETVLENVLIGCRLRTRSGVLRSIFRTGLCRAEEKDAHEKAMDILGFIGLATQAQYPATLLPQEAQKRLAIGISLATAPRILLLDEPVGGMSLEEGDQLVRLIGRMKERGVTVGLIEHRMRVVMSISDRIVVLNYGRKIAEGTPGEIRANSEVIEAYLGEEYAA